MFWVTSAQLKKKRCGDFKQKTGCSAEIGRLAQCRYRKSHPEITEAETQAFNKRREIERAQARVATYTKRYGKDVLLKWIAPQQTD